MKSMIDLLVGQNTHHENRCGGRRRRCRPSSAFEAARKRNDGRSLSVGRLFDPTGIASFQFLPRDSRFNFSNARQDNMNVNTDAKFLSRLRLLSIVEGTSTLLLFGIAMPLKYLADMPLAVRIVGSLHGLLFICLAIGFLLATQRVPISKKLATAGIIAAVLPFGPFVFDRWLGELDNAE
jgi:integral membrane protein